MGHGKPARLVTRPLLDIRGLNGGRAKLRPERVVLRRRIAELLATVGAPSAR